MKLKRLFIFLLFINTLFSLTAIDLPKAETSAEIRQAANGDFILFVTYIFPEGYHQSNQPEFFTFKIVSPENVSLGEIIYPEGDDYYGQTVLSANLTNYDVSAIRELTIKASYQLCNEDGMCFFPQSAELLVDSPPIPEKKSNIFFFLLLAFLGGILLNVMPCVLPVLSIKALSLVNQGGENKKEILKSSLLYAAGVIISLLVLAAIIIILKASGEQVGWGFQFQSRNFVLVLLTIIFVFALSLFDVFTISAPVIKSGAGIQKKQNPGAHFVSGIFAVLLATPCTAPFLGTAAGFAFSQTAPVILAVFFMVGLGLSLPFIIIGFIPAAVSKLPKPGAWMNTFRELMGFLLLATSIWLIDVLSHQSLSSSAPRVLIYLIVTTFAVWLYGKLNSPGASRGRRYIGLILSISVIIGTAGLLFFGNNTNENTVIESSKDSNYSDWIEFSPETVNSFAGGDNPVFVAFSAKWCMTCKTNENTVIFSEEIIDFFNTHKAVLIHGDYTNPNPDIDDWMQKYGRAGVPFYLWYPAGSKEAKLLPELLKRKTITNLIN